MLNKRIKIMNHSNGKDSTEEEKLLSFKERPAEAVAEETFLASVLAKLEEGEGGFTQRQEELKINQYIQVEVTVERGEEKHNSILTLVLEDEQPNRENYLNLARELLNSGKITTLIYSGLQSAEITTLSEAWQKWGHVATPSHSSLVNIHQPWHTLTLFAEQSEPVVELRGDRVEAHSCSIL